MPKYSPPMPVDAPMNFGNVADDVLPMAEQIGPAADDKMQHPRSEVECLVTGKTHV